MKVLKLSSNRCGDGCLGNQVLVEGEENMRLRDWETVTTGPNKLDKPYEPDRLTRPNKPHKLKIEDSLKGVDDSH